MQITDILSPDCTLCAAPGSSKKRILESISQLAHLHNQNFPETQILDALLGRERMGSTGIGQGIAIPHGRIDGLQKITAVLVTCKPGINFDAIDNQPVDVFFAILVPAEQTEGHLQTLATVAQKLAEKNTIKQIRNAQTNQELYEAIL
ncbi:PTS IIA-like nitrogen regulatory protein PtsN [Bowmanella sp. JS7-9]|uniref:PTS IIA-like nitrogen regulatory protein PtsN n=1 Tax=Pseudobowmanella zhangzhouensis TaxID=1537679 RepID=A0ABW1XQY3_9ALTE|nr:PTS IIA-like nitrogen regulatory protein PtsN [Bowmanella sp. JS7-9]TBX21834.1 hypothetical protein TK45_10010 [Bowmanella sp. JS7-9]